MTTVEQGTQQTAQSKAPQSLWLVSLPEVIRQHRTVDTVNAGIQGLYAGLACTYCDTTGIVKLSRHLKVYIRLISRL